MKKLNVSFGLFLLVVGVWYYFDLRSKRRPATEPPTAASDPWSPTTPEPAESQSVGPRLPPAAPIVSPEQIEAAFRLSPDRRCLWAVAGLHRLLTGVEKAATEAEFQSGRWQIRYRGQAVGDLPELPSFPDLFGLLTRWAERLRAESKSPPRVAGQPSSEITAALANLQPLAALQAADRLWSRDHFNPALARQAAQALALLALLGLHWLDRLSDVEAATEFSNNLDETPASAATEFRNWYAHLAKAKAGKGSAPELQGDLAEVTRFGEPLLTRTYEQLSKSAAYGDLTLVEAGRRLAGRLDTRPTHRLQMGMISRDGYLLSLAEKFLTSAVPARASAIFPCKPGMPASAATGDGWKNCCASRNYSHKSASVWELAPASLEGSSADSDYYWLMCAAAAIRPGSDLASHLPELRQHYARGAASRYDLAGRYLLGLAEQMEMLSAANDPKAQCELFYFVGYKAQCEGRFRNAADWYWLSYATGLLNNGEARWACDQLVGWKNQSRTLARLEAEAAKR